MTWPIVPLKECARIVGGATPKSEVDEYWNGDIRWVTPKDLSDIDGKFLSNTPRRITDFGLRNCSSEVLPPYSVLFSSRAPIGHVAINTVPMATNQGFKSMVPGPKLDASFLYWWLKCHRSQLEQLGNGATFKEVSKAVVERIEVPLPPLVEQKRIAAILDQADELRRKRQRALDRLNQLGQAIFIEMFGDPFSVPSSTVVDLDVLTERITYGFTSPMSHHDSGIPIITAKNVRYGFIDFSTCKYAVQSEFDALTDKSKPDKGDILVTKDGTIGRYAVFDADDPVCINQSVALIKPRRDRVISEYLAAYIGFDGVQKRFQAMKKGNAIPHLQITELAKFPVFLPSMTQQAELRDRLQQLEDVQAAASFDLAKLHNLFASLQHRAFRGELTAPTLNEAAA